MQFTLTFKFYNAKNFLCAFVTENEGKNDGQRVPEKTLTALDFPLENVVYVVVIHFQGEKLNQNKI